jgi:hypothetical protein
VGLIVSFRFVGFDAGRPLVRGTSFRGFRTNVPNQWLPRTLMPERPRFFLLLFFGSHPVPTEDFNPDVIILAACWLAALNW